MTWKRDNQVNQSVLMLFGVFGEEAREAVVRALDEVPGVKEVYVNMYRAEAMVMHDGRCTASGLAAAVNAVGVRRRGGQGAFTAQAMPSATTAPHTPPAPLPVSNPRSQP